MWYVYVIQNDINNRFYIGATNNISRRLREHNRGKTKSIAHFGAYHLVYSEKYSSLQEARQREQQIKAYKGGNAFKKLLHKRA